MFSENELDLTVQVNAAEWAYNQRRTLYLEALLVRLLRDENNFEEWLSADDLVTLRLPGLPASAAGITRKATAGKWRRQRDRNLKGRRFRYHVASLPARAFDTLLSRLLDLPEVEGEVLAFPDIQPPPMPDQRPTALTAPPWVLPLMRLMKNDSDLAAAWRDLPHSLPPGVELPTVEEAAMVLVRFGLTDR
ncbi:DNA-binding protein [Devosia sp.]|uniref:DNA-binding protein n=1 Tax=Devosia sp. TaxID=1871048 RepID=UPI001AC37897|nr:DNA-binding protein [Devosia sp.]MBN9332528.1 hypothetical protein [Devosia sp.]